MSDQVHQFTVGQLVEIIPSMMLSVAKGSYEIRRLVPVSASDPQYRLKSTNEAFERVVTESHLRLLGGQTIKVA